MVKIQFDMTPKPSRSKTLRLWETLQMMLILLTTDIIFHSQHILYILQRHSRKLASGVIHYQYPTTTT